MSPLYWVVCNTKQRRAQSKKTRVELGREIPIKKARIDLFNKEELGSC